MSVDSETVIRAATVKRLYQSLRSGDRDTVNELLSSDFVGHATEGLPLDLGGEHRGPEAMQREFWWLIGRSFSAAVEPDEIRALDDGRMLVHGRYRGEGRNSGNRLDAEFIHLLTFGHDGRITALHQLTDTVAWVHALGDDETLKAIDYHVDGGVATICLNRPSVRNAIDLRLAEETLDVARRVAEDPVVRAVLICGDGPALSVGGDIDFFLTAPPETFGALFARMTTPFHEAFRVLSRVEVPIVTAAHGAVAGGGLGYVYAADLVIAAEGTQFVTAFAALGLSGDGGGTWHLPRLIGPRRAAQAYLRNTPITAAEALEWGLVNEVVPTEDVRVRAAQVASELATGPTRAYACMRALLRDSWTNDLSAQLTAETEALRAVGCTPDAQAAISGFNAKQAPEFTGS